LAQLGLTAKSGRDAQVTGLAVDSREVRAGTLFAALPGTRVHGASFIPTALAQGAAAILTDAEGARLAADALAAADAALVVVEDPRQALACAAALWFGAQPATMVAVTGTNGKTSVATFTRQIWEEMDLPAVNLGTTGVEGAYEVPLRHTTPEPITLHRVLAQAAAAGVTHAAMEASSHGLAQRRLDGVHLRAAGFTNLTQDHLDYHADFADYFNAKAGLFARVLGVDGTAVVNVDDSRGMDMANVARTRGQEVITVGRRDGADLQLVSQRFDATGQTVLCRFRGKTYSADLALLGGFQAENVLVAVGLVIACGADPDGCSRRCRIWARCADGCSLRPRAQMGRRSLSITPIRPMRSPRPSRRCARM
jgi:UDP-N-acetylmuramoyl-L-alanyl-D-glutamate--2,6-diaminopimelate ligase